MNDEYFQGRTEEQDKFTNILGLLNSKAENDKPEIFLLHGIGGIGKTTLLEKFKEIAEEQFPGKFNIVFLDWEKKRDREYSGLLKVGFDNIKPTDVLEVIYQSLCKQGWKQNLSRYEIAKKLWKDAEEKIEKALESGSEDKNVQELRPLGKNGIVELLRESRANGGEEEFKSALEFVQKRLTLEESDIYREPNNKLALALGSGITNIARKKPLVIFLDTYEIVNRPECDNTLREAIKRSRGRILWVIAGRTNLAESGMRNPEAKNALLSALKNDPDADVKAIAIRLLGKFEENAGVPSLVGYLNHSDRYVREAAVRELRRMVKYQTTRKEVLQLASDSLIEVLKTDPIKDVREAARDALITIYNERKSLQEQEREREKFNNVKHALWTELNTIDEQERKEKNWQKIWTELNNKIKKKEGEGTESLDELLQWLENKRDRYVREAAANALGKLVPTQTTIIEALNKAARQDDFSSVRDAAENSLNLISNQNSSNLASRATIYLERIKQKPPEPLDISDINELSSILRSSDNIELRIRAVQTLGKFKLLEAENLLCNCLNDDQADVCATAARVLGEYQDSSVLKILLDRIDNSHRDKNKIKDRIVDAAVIHAIGNIKCSGEQLNELEVIKKLIERWRNEVYSTVRDEIEAVMKTIYALTLEKTVKTALKRYGRYDSDNRKKEELNNFFTEVEKKHAK